VRDSTDHFGLQSRSLSEAEREALFKRLHLAHMRRIYQEVAVQAEKEGWSYADFLALLLAEEVAGRKQTRLQRLTRSAHFPFLKTMDEFDFSLQSTLRLALLGSYLGPELVSEGRSLILHGKTGRGKTHLAVAIGYRAIQNGFETLFTTAAELIEDLSNASKKGRLQESLATYTHPHVLVVDEVGYLTYAPDAANVLFHVVNNRHLRKRPMVFTTNKPLNEWGKVLHDEDLAAAILDRVLERGRFIRLDGPSGRTRHLKLEELLPGATERFRISGKNGSEFPEPTTPHQSLGKEGETCQTKVQTAVSIDAPNAIRLSIPLKKSASTSKNTTSSRNRRRSSQVANSYNHQRQLLLAFIWQRGAMPLPKLRAA
jgi:DNA replication protein DnaC